MAVWISFAVLVAFPVVGNATIFTVDYTGTVDTTFSYSGAPLPTGVTAGAAVVGSITFDTAFAEAPTYTLSSCSGSCGGDAVTSYFDLTGHLTESVTIAGTIWSADFGEVWLDDNFLIPGSHIQSIGADNGTNGYDSSLGVYFSRVVDSVALFSDVNIDGLMFENATSGYGTIDTGADGYYIGYGVDPPLSVPEPSAFSIFGFGVAIMAAMARDLTQRQIRIGERLLVSGVQLQRRNANGQK